MNDPAGWTGGDVVRRAARTADRMCNQHNHAEECADLNHRRDVHYLREMLLMLGLIDENNDLVDIKS